MRLNSLRIKGFKSFANDTLINFSSDVIGIVGPNGCGKSNVIDSIRWVLGEQKSKHLRLDKMTSVIFNGTKAKKKAGVAEVSLTFDNTKNILPTEYGSVTITRTLYRSGESEYKLNGVTCRLKDITALFLDTGIGSNSYAIIELGMVDKILTDKDSARRRMFEQAAGISKYKKRKKDTLNKLAATKADLDRVDDLLHEIQGNLKQLERQAKRTEKYFALKDKYKKNSIVLAKQKLSSFETKDQTLKASLLQEEELLTEIIAKKNAFQSDLESFKKDILENEMALSSKQQEFNELVKKTDEKENRLKIIEQRLDFLSNDKSKLQKAITEAESKIGDLGLRKDNYQSTLVQENELLNTLQHEYTEVKSNLERIQGDHDEIKKELDSITSFQKSYQETIIGLEKEKAILKSQDQQLSAEFEKMEKLLAEQEIKINKLNKDFSESSDALAIKAKELEVKEKELTSLLESKEKLDKEKEELSTEFNQKSRKLDAKQNEFNLVRNLVEKMEGFPDSVKFLSNLKSWQKDTQLLSDLIYCEEKYKIAIESYLEPYLKYFVVDQVDDAVNAISILGESQKGKANFLLLDVIDSNPVLLTTKPSLGTPALSILEFDKKYENLFKMLLGNVYLSESEMPDHSINLSDEEVILSLSGNYKQEKFALSGGSVGLFEGKRLGRKKNLEKLSQDIEALKSEIANLEKREAIILDKLEGLESQIKTFQTDELKKELNKIEQEKMSFELHLKNEDVQFNQFKNRIGEIEVTRKSISDNLVKINSNIQVNESEIGTYSAQIESKDSNFSVMSLRLTELSSAVNTKNIELVRQQNKIELLEKELEYCSTQLSENEGIFSNSNQTISSLEKELVDGSGQISTIKEELVGLYEVKKVGSSNLSEVEKNYFQKRSVISDKENELRSYDQKLSKSNEVIASLKDRAVNVKIELTSITERLKAEFEIETSDLEAVVLEEGLDEEALEELVNKAKNKIANFGEINPMALTAFDEMKERFDSINEQRNDILNARDSLLETIAEIEESASAQFMVAFTQVRTYFKEVFRSLFTEEDDCDLILSDEDNPLDSEIKILAKPKGKRPQSISQLSGGEKTLTATALLFSLYLLKPAPFCIFDEVDAPLDDANIEKFNKIIRKFSKDSQFIIVTHNKQTMASVDVIYGIYMQEQGVSSVSPVDFRELDHTSVLEMA